MTAMRLAITSGEPAGIGPDLCLRLAEQSWQDELVVLCDQKLLAARAKEMGVEVSFRRYDANEPVRASQRGVLTVCDIQSRADVITGVLNPSNSDYVIALLDRAIAGINLECHAVRDGENVFGDRPGNRWIGQGAISRCHLGIQSGLQARDISNGMAVC